MFSVGYCAQARQLFARFDRIKLTAIRLETKVNCPKCHSEHAYPEGHLWTCPECFHQWNQEDAATAEPDAYATPGAICDAHGNVLKDGDSLTVIKDLKIKGASSVVKVGTKIRNIRLIDASDGHSIACKIDGIGAINLKPEFVKKV